MSLPTLAYALSAAVAAGLAFSAKLRARVVHLPLVVGSLLCAVNVSLLYGFFFVERASNGEDLLGFSIVVMAIPVHLAALWIARRKLSGPGGFTKSLGIGTIVAFCLVIAGLTFIYLLASVDWSK